MALDDWSLAARVRRSSEHLEETAFASANCNNVYGGFFLNFFSSLTLWSSGSKAADVNLFFFVSEVVAG